MIKCTHLIRVFQQDESFAADIANVVNGKIGAYNELTPDVLRSILPGINNVEILPDNVFFKSKENGSLSIIAYRPAAWNTVKTVQGEKYSFKHPTFVYSFIGSRFSVYVTWDDIPTPDSQLYNAPYANIYSDGHMCTGNIPLKLQNKVDTIEGFDELFFGTNFTHEFGSLNIKKYLETSSIIGKAAKGYLIPTDKKVKDLWM